MQAAANEVHDLQLISFVQPRLRPAIARDDLAIQFDGYTVGFHPKLFHERAQGSRGSGTGFAINGQIHRGLKGWLSAIAG
jgi:hypothetical protein